MADDRCPRCRQGLGKYMHYSVEECVTALSLAIAMLAERISQLEQEEGASSDG